MGRTSFSVAHGGSFSTDEGSSLLKRLNEAGPRIEMSARDEI